MAETGQHDQRYERYEGGSPEAERLVFERLARELMRGPGQEPAAPGRGGIARTFHAKAPLGVENARLTVPRRPAGGRCGSASRSRAPSTRRRSGCPTRAASGSPTTRPTCAARRCASGGGARRAHDLLITSYPVSHASDAREFVAFAKAMAGARSHAAEGVRAVREAAAGGRAGPRPHGCGATCGGHDPHGAVNPLPMETYWSRGAILWGEAGPVRYLLRPAPRYAGGGRTRPPRTPTSCTASWRDGSGRRTSCSTCACSGTWTSGAHRSRTRRSSGRTRWHRARAGRAADHPAPGRLDGAEAAAAARRIEDLAFNPWYTTEEFRPLGNLNRARKAAYEASGAHRLGPAVRHRGAPAQRRARPSRGRRLRAAQPFRAVAPAAAAARAC